MRRESHLKARCIEEVKKELPKFVVFSHQEFARHGVPDNSITGRGKTTWWEFKHGTPHFDSTGIQELTMLRLAGAGFARYVIFLEDAGGLSKRILIVHPKDLRDLHPEASCVGHNYKFVVDYIKQVHHA